MVSLISRAILYLVASAFSLLEKGLTLQYTLILPFKSSSSFSKFFLFNYSSLNFSPTPANSLLIEVFSFFNSLTSSASCAALPAYSANDFILATSSSSSAFWEWTSALSSSISLCFLSASALMVSTSPPSRSTSAVLLCNSECCSLFSATYF